MTSLQCTYENCTSGENGSRWKSPEMAAEAAVQLLGFHIQGVHMELEAKPAIQHKNKLEKITRPSLSSGCDAGDFTFFKMEWERYKSNSGEKDDSVLRDQLLQCADEDLAQDRGEAIRKFGARIRGRAAVCNLTVDCSSCKKPTSYTDQIVLAAMVKGLNDDDTKMEILSKVTKMTLEDTITFIEARETGSKSATALSKNALASTSTNVVEVKSL